MDGIPPAAKTDAEDVAWALQTADALWKRGERGDAVVWLRRAAQAAGDAQDDDRALMLARSAAELSEWVALNPHMPDAAPRSGPPPVSGGTDPPARAVRSAAEAHAGMLDPWAEDRKSAHTSDQFEEEEEETQTLGQGPAQAAIEIPTAESSGSVVNPDLVESVPPSAFDEGDEEVITSARTLAAVTGEVKVPPELMAESPSAVEQWEKQAAKPSAPPPRSSPAKVAAPPPPRPVPSTAPAAPRPMSVSKKPPPPPPPRPPAAAKAPPRPPPPVPARKPPPPPPRQAAPPAFEVVEELESITTEIGATPVEQAVKPGLDLSKLESFADLPDDARQAFERAAVIHELKKEEEASGFALAVVLEGEVDVAATIVDAAAERLKPFAVLRSQGSIGEGLPLRLVAASPQAKVATWDDAAVADAFRTCPWVEEDLRVAADRIHAIVGITMGPLAERLDASIRKLITDRLDVRGLEAGQVLVRRGEPMPGIILLGVGEVEVMADDEKTVAATVSPGEFLFSTSVFGGEAAPATARAATDGAVILIGNRNVAQELLVTCPPLLEVLAGM